DPSAFTPGGLGVVAVSGVLCASGVLVGSVLDSGVLASPDFASGESPTTLIVAPARDLASFWITFNTLGSVTPWKWSAFALLSPTHFPWTSLAPLNCFCAA